ncbi:hypothetical protein SFR_4233 [Streptomyces sp. FR-008]|nr:hypothetical protein SFR_4233 [Streptomyces sp. FR-008]
MRPKVFRSAKAVMLVVMFLNVRYVHKIVKIRKRIKSGPCR